MTIEQNIENALLRAIKKINITRKTEVDNNVHSLSDIELRETEDVTSKRFIDKHTTTAEQLKKKMLADIGVFENEHSNVVSITSKEKASVSKAEPKLVKLFEYLPAAASSKENEYKWFHFQGEITDSQGNKSILKMTPVGGNEMVELIFKPSKDSSILDVDESYLGKKLPLVIKVANHTFIEGEVFISANKDELIGEGKIIGERIPDTSVKPLEYFILDDSK